jgi:hypothetical protein
MRGYGEEVLLGAGVDDVDGGVGRRLDPVPADEEAIGVAHG